MKEYERLRRREQRKKWKKDPSRAEKIQKEKARQAAASKKWRDKKLAEDPEFLARERTRLRIRAQTQTEADKEKRKEVVKKSRTKISVKIKQRLREYRKNAKSRGLEWKLENSEAEWFFRCPCHYCDAPPAPLNGIDRIDSSGSYDIGNIVTACQQCNYSKKDLPYDDFTKWIDRLVQYRNQINQKSEDSDVTQ